MTMLSERAVLARLSIGLWSGSLLDREITEEVASNHQAERDAGRYSKKIVATKYLRTVSSKVNAARQTHRALTLPWDDDSTRILSNMGYLSYAEKMRTERLAITAAVDAFVQPENWEAIQREAKTRLGSMFDAEDYPTPEEVRGKFYIDVEIRPVPEAGDFRAQLSEASVKAIVKDIERRTDQRIETAMKDAFQRVADVTNKMVERLRAAETNGEKAIFRDSLVTNIKELADLLPSLNITGDERLNKLQQQLLSDLVDHSPEVLRSDAKARKQTCDRAERIYRKACAYLK